MTTKLKIHLIILLCLEVREASLYNYLLIMSWHFSLGLISECASRRKDLSAAETLRKAERKSDRNWGVESESRKTQRVANLACEGGNNHRAASPPLRSLESTS